MATNTPDGDICIACGARNPRGMFCPMSVEGEGPHEFIVDQPAPSGLDGFGDYGEEQDG